MGEISLKSINQTGLIITLSREIESLMTQLGAVEAGLHDKTDHLAPKLPEECIKLLHYIAAVRNKNAHEVTDIEDFDMDFFCDSCETVMEELRQLLIKEKNIEPELNIVQQETYQIEDVEKKFGNEFKAMMRLCGYLPLLNVVFFLYKIITEFIKAADKVAGVIFLLMSLLIMSGSLLEKNFQYFYCGAILFGMVYIYGIILAIIQRKQQLKFSSFAFIPFFNLSYFIYGSYVKIRIFPVLYYSAGLTLYILTFLFYYKYDKTSYALNCAWICYLLGFLGIICETIREKIKKN